MEKEIKITEIEGIKIGQAENAEAATGCTVIVSENGMAAGLDVRGGGPASRDSELLNPLAAAGFVHAVVLAGGSAFGLGCANGVMEYLEAHDIGFDVGVTKVPLVVQSDLFDLTVGDKSVRPDPAMGYEAVKHAMEDPNYKDGNYGAGCGATVGKLAGMETCMKSGIGSYAIQIVYTAANGTWFRIYNNGTWGSWYSYAKSDHVHGHINNNGTITSNGVDLASGDRLAIVDSSDSSLVKKTNISFDGSTTSKALTQKGTFESVMLAADAMSFATGNGLEIATSGTTATLSMNISAIPDSTITSLVAGLG